MDPPTRHLDTSAPSHVIDRQKKKFILDYRTTIFIACATCSLFELRSSVSKYIYTKLTFKLVLAWTISQFPSIAFINTDKHLAGKLLIMLAMPEAEVMYYQFSFHRSVTLIQYYVIILLFCFICLSTIVYTQCELKM